MSMSTCITGFKPPNKKWHEMKAVWDACAKAEIATPREVDEFFESVEPDENGVEIPDFEKHECVQEYWSDSASGFEVDVTKRPKDVTIIRFWNGW